MEFLKEYGGAIGSLVGGVLVALVTFWLSKNKQKAETKKLNAEADSLSVDTALKLVSRFEAVAKSYEQTANDFKEQVELLTAANTALKKS